MGACVAQNVLWLDVSMTNSLSVNIGNRPHKLIRVQLYYQIWNHLLHLEVLLHHSICCIRNVVHNDVEVNLIRLFTISIETLPHFNAIWVMEHFQNGQLSILIPFVLEYFLYCYSLTSFSNSCLKHNTK